jgi:threonine/homoserine/homoserine lactone efflux protein
MAAALLAGVVAGYAVALPVGAVAAYLVSLAARHPWHVGAAGALGVATVDGAYALLAALGGAAVATVVQPVAAPLRVVAAVVLLGIAAHTAWKAWAAWRDHRSGRVADDGGGPVAAWRTYARLVAITAVNPATVLFFVVVVAGWQVPDGGGRVTAAMLFGLGAFASSASWQLVLVTAGTALGRVLSGPRGRLGTGLASAGLMVMLAVVMLARG